MELNRLEGVAQVLVRRHRAPPHGAKCEVTKVVHSTIAWMCYALSVPNFFIVASNLPGAIAAVYFISTTLPLSKGEGLALVKLVLVGGAAAMLTSL